MNRIKNEMIKTEGVSSDRGWHWSIYFTCSQNDGYDMNVQFQSTTCMTCGKYVFVGNNVLHEQIQNNPRLVCVDEEHHDLYE